LAITEPGTSGGRAAPLEIARNEDFAIYRGLLLLATVLVELVEADQHVTWLAAIGRPEDARIV
jgi:hypothetical protein